MQDFTLAPIGFIHFSDAKEPYIQLDPAYRSGLTGLVGFSHVQVLWLFHGSMGEAPSLLHEGPYVKGPAHMGVFATRGPFRPNPLALTTAHITYIDQEKGMVGLAYTDAWEGSPVLDIKPYTPSLDRVEKPGTPAWCAHWPQSVEASASFDWEAEFNF